MPDPVTDQVEEPMVETPEPEGDEHAEEKNGKPSGTVEVPAPKKSRKLRLGEEEIDLAAFNLPDDLAAKLEDVGQKYGRTGEMVRGAQAAFRQAAEAKAEAQKMRRETMQVLDTLRSQPGSALARAGLTEAEQRAFAEQVIAQEMVKSGINPQTGEPLTPQERAALAAEERLREAEQRASTLEKEREQAQREQLKAAIRQKLDQDLTGALQESGLPATDSIVRRLATLVADWDFEVPARELAILVQQDVDSEVDATLVARAKSLSPEEFVKRLPKEVVEVVRKHDVEQARRGRLPASAPRVLTENRQWADKRRHRVTSPREAQAALDEWAELPMGQLPPGPRK